ncbi:MAG: glycoside hydrolase family 3 N-terminal domain-containing protein, partial [Pseudomonadota bacterium]
ALPRVTTPRAELDKSDFEPFKRLAHHALAMTAHVVYEAVDSEAPATMSSTVISQVIRQQIGFQGLLMTDDLSMHALSGDFASRTQDAFAAGCDVVLHCNSDMGEMGAIADALHDLAGDAAHRAAAALQVLPDPDDEDEAALRAEFSALVEQTNS